MPGPYKHKKAAGQTARRGDALLNYSTIMLLPVISAGTGSPM